MAKSGQIIFPIGDPPETPQSGKVTVYGKNNKVLYYKDDTGAEYPLSASGVVTNHGNLTGLDADDHTQYLLRADFATSSGDIVSQIPTTLVELNDTPSSYDDGKYLQSTAGGTVWTTVSAAGGTSNHSELNELDYASSGHTGFTSTAALTSTSGVLQSEIDGKSDTGHDHTESDITDLDKYTQAEVDTISGTLQSEIDGKSDTGHDHTESDITDLDKYTQSEVDSLIASASGTTDHNALNNLGYGSSGHTGFASSSDITTLSGNLQTEIDAKPDTLLELTDTPSSYDSGKFLKSTAAGTEWATVSGGTGTSDHSELSNLDYASSAHTGFASSSDLSTASGTLQSQIDGKADTVHSHTETDITDLDKYTQAEVDTISGTLQSEIDGKSDTGHAHTESDITDLDKYTQSEVDALIATASGTTDHSALNNLDYASSGHTGFASDSDLTTLSGNLQSEIDGKSDTGHGHTESDITDLDKYTQAEVDTISGTLQSEIDGKSDTGHAHTESDITDLDKYTQAEVDTISGTLQSDIDAKPDTLLELTDTPSSYDSGKFLRSTVDGTQWVTVSGGTGTDNHSELINLDYDNAGHTGFASWDALITLSGSISDGIHGSEYDTAESESLTSTSLTTYQTKIAITKGQTEPAGNYRLGWTMDYNGSSANKDIWVRMYNLTDGLTYSENNIKSNDGGAWYTITGFKSISLSGSDKTFQLQYRAGTSSCAVKNARLEIWRME